MKKNEKQLFATSIVVLSVFGILFYKNIWQIVQGEKGNINYPRTAITMVLILCAAYMIYAFGKVKYGEIVLICVIGILALLCIFGDRNYSVIDEMGHYDYICHIANNHRLPTMYDWMDTEVLNEASTTLVQGGCIQYEAVQGPFYYALLAVLTFFISNVSYKFLAVRVLGLFMIGAVYCLARKTYNLLVQHGVFRENPYDIYILMLFTLNPGVVYRLTKVTNESLLYLLAACAMYLYTKLLVEGFDTKLAYVALVIGILMFWTKSTGGCMVGGLFLILIYYKKWKHFFVSIAGMGLGVLPWFLYNLKTYGTLTAIKLHVDFALPVVNPKGDPVPLIHHLLQIFNGTFLTQSEIEPNKITLVGRLEDFLGICCLILVLFYLCYAIKRIVEWMKNRLVFGYGIAEKTDVLYVIAIALVVAEILLLMIGTWKTDINILLGRYLYIQAMPLTILAIGFCKKESKNFSQIITACICCFLAGSYFISIVTCANTIIAQ